MADTKGWHDVDPLEFWGDLGVQGSMPDGAGVDTPTGVYSRIDDQMTLDNLPIDREATVTLRRQLYGILVQMTGARKYDLYRLEKRYTLVGRAKSDRVDISLDDLAVSNPHTKLIVDLDEEGKFRGVIAEDQESENGTWVNGKLVNRAPLNDRDILKLGETELMFIRI